MEKSQDLRCLLAIFYATVFFLILNIPLVIGACKGIKEEEEKERAKKARKKEEK